MDQTGYEARKYIWPGLSSYSPRVTPPCLLVAVDVMMASPIRILCSCISSLRPASGLRTTLAGWPGGRERSLLNRGLCCEDEISSAAPDPGGKELLAWGVNEPRRPRGGGRQPIGWPLAGCPCMPGIESWPRPGPEP